MPPPLQLLTTLEYLGPYDGADPPAKDTYFGLVLQAGSPNDAAGDPATVAVADGSLLQPWLWSSPAVEIRPWANGLAGAPLTVSLVPQGTVSAPLTASLESQFKHAITNADFAWPDSKPSMLKPGTTQYSWPTHLAQLGRYPYPIPHRLQLSYLVKVDPSQLALGTTYVGTVSFSTSVNGAPITFAPAGFAADPSGRVAITYTQAAIADVTALTQPLMFTSAVPASLPLKVTAEVTDWQAQLAARSADMFDLSNRLVRALRQELSAAKPVSPTLSSNVAQNFATYVTAVLAAQRDIVCYGCQRGPDGGSVLSRTLSLWSAGATVGSPADRDDFADRLHKFISALRATDATASDRFQQKWLMALVTSPDFKGSPLLPALPVAVDKIKPFTPSMAVKAGDVVSYQQQLFQCRQDRGQTPTPPVPVPPPPSSLPPATPGSAGAASDWKPLTLTLTVPTFVNLPTLSDRLLPVEQLQLQLTQVDVLSRILIAQWTAVTADWNATLPAALTGFLQPFLSRASAILSNLDVRGLLVRGNLQGTWEDIVKAPATRQQVRSNLKTQLTDSVAGRMPLLLADLPGKPACPFQADLIAKLNDWLAGNLSDVVPDDASSDAAAAAAPRATEGLSLALNDDALDDSTDTLRKNAGLIMLMRESGGVHPWRCLNLAYATLDDGSPVAPDLATTALAVPVPEHIQENLRRAIFTYNNQPLMAQSPAHNFSDKLVPEQGSERMVRFQHPSMTESLDAAANQWKKIPGLGFGRNYDFYIARSTNTGALPPELAGPGTPGHLKDLASVTVTPSITSVAYQRKSPINALRFGVRGETFQQISWPPIPQDVFPYAQELGVMPTASGPGDSRPLAMLTSYQTTPPVAAANSSFTLPVFKPTTDLLTWDRWMAGLDTGTGNTAIRQTRTLVWTAFHQQARQESTKTEVAIEDPAITLLAVSIAINSPGYTLQGTPVTKSWAPAPAIAPGSSLQPMPNPAPPLKLQFGTLAAGTVIQVTDNGTDGWTIQLPPGAVISVTITPGVDPKSAAFFTGGVLPVVPSYTLVAEAADSSLPTQSDLQNALKIVPPNVPGASLVNFELALGTGKGAVAHGVNIRSADLRQQSWRWDGRPMPFFPASAMDTPVGMSNNPDLLAWELQTFLNRTASDSSVRSMARKPGGGYSFIAGEDRSTEQGATYYRAGVTVYNRYGSLVPAANRSRSTLNDDTASTPGSPGGWNRCFVHARVPAAYKPPKPAVKFIVPLTGAEDSAQAPGAGSALVVVQGPWYAIGGLVEALKVELTTADQTPNPSFQEAGPDPITYNGTQADLNKTYDFNGCLHPPVGHTFDSSDTNPLWVNSSFVLDPPHSGKAPAPAGTFARVQFRRVLRQQGTQTTDLKPLPGPLESDATDPVWIQFLPGRFSPFNAALDSVTLTVTNGTARLMQKGVPVELSTDSSVNNEHTLFALLLTEQVTDMVGRRGQERFLHVLLTRPPGSKEATWQAAGLEGNANYVGRILVIQRQIKTTNNKAPGVLTDEHMLWDEMFPPAASNRLQSVDAVSRIVAVSPPISAAISACTAQLTPGS